MLKVEFYTKKDQVHTYDQKSRVQAELVLDFFNGISGPNLRREMPLKNSNMNLRRESSRASCGLNIGHLSMTKLQQLLPSSSDPPVFATATKSTLK